MAKRTCVVEGCEKPRGYAQGWCPMHYQRWTVHGSLDKPAKRVKPTPEPCSIDGCDELMSAKGMCGRHYKADYHQQHKQREAERQQARRDTDRPEYLAKSRAYYASNSESVLAQMAKRYAEDPEPKRRAAKVYREANLDQVRETKRTYYLKNRNQISKWHAAYYAANHDAARETQRRWREANPEKQRESGRRWREANPVRRREVEMRRRARKRGGKVTKADYVEILAEHGMVCHICTLVIKSMADLHFDHVIPLAKEGPHARENIKPAHATCNMRKYTKLLA